MENLKARIVVGAEAAYVAIETPTETLDIKLAGGRGAAQSLVESAALWRTMAARLMRKAELAEAAAAVI